MKPLVLTLFVVALVVLVVAARLGSLPRVDPPAAQTKAGQTKAAQGMPGPPAQRDERWVPPKSLVPASLINAATALFGQGFGDPRDCEYREVELAGEAEAYRQVAPGQPPTHAWVIPAAAKDGPRFAVGWNGLVYPVTRIGPRADVEVDVRSLLEPVVKGANARGPRGRRCTRCVGFIV